MASLKQSTLIRDLIDQIDLLAEDIEKRNPGTLNPEKTARRMVQALVFIRTLEMKGSLDKTPRLDTVRSAEDLKGLLAMLDRESGIQAIDPEHSDLKISDQTLKDIIDVLYRPYDHESLYYQDTDIPGIIHERYPCSGNSGNRNSRKRKGTYYTPPQIVEYMVNNAFRHYCGEDGKVRGSSDVLDMSCGSGRFLVKAYEAMIDRKLRGDIYGIDIDPEAAHIARTGLALKKFVYKSHDNQVTIDIRSGNSLIDDTRVTPDAFFWKIWQKDGFDIILGNPPWVFTRGRHFNEGEKAYFDNWLRNAGITQERKGRNVQSGKLSLPALFIVKTIQLLKEGGIACLILPDTIMRATTYDTVRKYILDNCKIISITDIKGGAFDNVTASAVILTITRETDAGERRNNIIRVYTGVNDANAHGIPQNRFMENGYFMFNFNMDTASCDICEDIERGSVTLGTMCRYIIEGIVCSTKKDVSDARAGRECKPFITGREIERYGIRNRGRFVRYDKHRLHRARPEEVFTSKKIMIRRISGGDRPLAGALDDGRYYTFASINNLILKEDCEVDLRYILAVINSTLMNWYYTVRYSNGSKLTVNISKTYVEQMPVRIPDRELQDWIAFLVDRITALKKALADSGALSEAEKISMERNIQETDVMIDDLIFRAYGINDHERKMISNYDR